LFGALQKGVGRIYSINQLADNPFRRKASMFNQQLLTGRRILVTGGGTGLGKSIAARFLELAPRFISAAAAKASATKPRPS